MKSDLHIAADGSQASRLLAGTPWPAAVLADVLGMEHQHADTPHPMRLLRARRERPRHSRAAQKRDELASSYVEHRLLPGTRCASLAQALSALPLFSRRKGKRDLARLQNREITGAL